MKRSSFVLTVVLASVFCGGCSHIPFIGKKKPAPGAPKQSKYIATDVEKEFEGRWVDKRADELISQGQPEDAARTQAVSEFKQKFAATAIAQQVP